jgi:surface protein
MEWMFRDCRSLTTLDVSSFNTSNVTTMYKMFDGCHALTTLNLSNFNVSKVTNFGGATPFISGNLLVNLTSPKNISSSFTIHGCPVLSKASVIGVINNLSDFASAGILTTAAVTLPARFATELSASEQGEIIRKGWNLSFV